MAKTKDIQPVFKARDGSHFATKDEAARHNVLLAAHRKVAEGVREAMNALAKTGKTADGQPFDLDRWDYWRIVNRWDGGLPLLASVYVHCRFAEVDVEIGAIVIRDFDRNQNIYITLRVDELYMDKANAQRAHVDACRKRLAELTAQVKVTVKGYGLR